jgi:aminoglycoside 2''-phosphotransferase
MNNSYSLYKKSEKKKVKKITTTYKKILEHCFNIKVFEISYVGGGSHRVFHVNNEYIFRFTHNVPLNFLKREKEVLTFLHNRVSIPVPQYKYYCETCPSLKGAAGGYPKLQGEPLQDVSIENPQKIAHHMGRVLSELHAVEYPELFDYQKVLQSPITFYHTIQKYVFPVLTQKEQKWTHTLFKSYISTSWDFKPVFVHGDCDSSNILYNPDTGISGLIDFEDAGIGDPAWDFCALHAEYGNTFLKNMISTYEPQDATLIKRIQFHARRIIFHEIVYGVQYNHPEYTKNGLIRLKKAVNNCDKTGAWLKKPMSFR